MSETRPYRRRQFFIKKEFQGKFVLFYAVSVVSLAGIATLVFARYAGLTIDRHIYSSHIKIARSGELIRGILFEANLACATAVILLVIGLSLYIFHRLNCHFWAMEERFTAMARGDFSLPRQPGSRFNEISELIDLSEEVRTDYRQRYIEIGEVLGEIEEALACPDPAAGLRDARTRLDALLAQVRLTEGGGG